MMTIVLNGINEQVENNISVNQLLESLGLSEKRLAVEINQQIIPRSDFPSHKLKEKDNVEIVQAIGGGQPAKLII
jgi:thiamine biosynthesis protein ThiS